MVGSAKEQAKAEKKAAKAKLKAEKKANQTASHVPAGGSDGGPSPAERSAAAAEKQVALQRFRVLFALLMFIVATAMLLWTVKPWRFLSGEDRPKSVPTTAAPEEP